MSLLRHLHTLILLCGVSLYFAPKAHAEELLVGAAASMHEVLQEVAKGFSASSHVPVKFSFAASSELVNQTKHGAPFDAIITADTVTMDLLERESLLTRQSRIELVGNELVLVVAVNSPAAKASLKSPTDLRKDIVKRIVLCDTVVPAGHYAQELLTRLGLVELLRPKFVFAVNVRAALALVASGAADVGFVYRTDVAIAKQRVNIIYTAGAETGLNIRYPAAIIRSSAKQASALSFLTYLKSQQALAVFERHGFLRL